MTLRELLVEREGAVCGRWLDAVLRDYGELTASRWRREKDRFANPVGHALATGLPEIFEAAIGDGAPDSGAAGALEEILRIRSVQEIAPSRAVGFVARLREAIRDELAPEIAGGTHAAELSAIDARIERLVFLAFDRYVALREQVFRLRQEELKRSVGSILRRWHGAGEAMEAEADLVGLSPPPKDGGRR
jgi:hypothetical protein